MPKQAGEISKTQRILSIYHLLTNCDEVSMQELTNLLPGSKKTFSRDIALLKKAGIQVRYSFKRQAFVLAEKERDAPDFPDAKSEARYIAKIIRLITVMDGLPEEDCDVWYMQAIPGAAKRTMQRDFAMLNSIGYKVKYEREAWNMHDAGMDVPPNRYYCDRPEGAYTLDTFNE